MLFSKSVVAAGVVASVQAITFPTIDFASMLHLGARPSALARHHRGYSSPQAPAPSVAPVVGKAPAPVSPVAGKPSAASPVVGKPSAVSPVVGKPSSASPVVGKPSSVPQVPAASPSTPGKATTAPAADGSCPAVWKTISTELTGMFVGGGGCTDAARSAIRAVFHDCFPAGGCDGSLALFTVELSRPENSPMASTMTQLKALAQKHSVGVADMLMFAGSHAVVSCPGGPITKTFIGRVDAKAAAPAGQLPGANVSAADAKSHFASKGFSATDLVALIGAHTASRQFNTDASKSGASQDSTPGIWDLIYFAQTILKIAPFTIPADLNLVADATTGPIFKSFSTNKGGWDAAFSPAFAKMQVLGAGFTQVDCTSALPRGLGRRSATSTPNYARSIINSLSLAKKSI